MRIPTFCSNFSTFWMLQKGFVAVKNIGCLYYTDFCKDVGRILTLQTRVYCNLWDTRGKKIPHAGATDKKPPTQPNRQTECPSTPATRYGWYKCNVVLLQISAVHLWKQKATILHLSFFVLSANAHRSVLRLSLRYFPYDSSFFSSFLVFSLLILTILRAWHRKRSINKIIPAMRLYTQLNSCNVIK